MAGKSAPGQQVRERSSDHDCKGKSRESRHRAEAKGFQDDRPGQGVT